ncbi:cytochrome P450 [Streptomyces sp. NBC_01017]|uniref:cytochrome P450 n=1 Tax=Streptomyces sp. NBC_01017 TaxID=2903721 RepID=UPI003870439B|nr:cytochrome P450 [Streptomyces sp. NBC_01017]WSV35095.1 cytochrome P450 [Streptomyces sp. NBC_01017]
MINPLSTTTSGLQSGRAPGAIPLLGHTLALLRDPLGWIASLAQHGDLVEVQFGRARMYVPCHPELMHEMLLDNRTFDKGGPVFETMRDVFGNTVVTSTHADHRGQRRRLQPSFRHQHLANYAPVMTATIEEIIGGWTNAQSIEVGPAMYAISLKTTLRALFGADDVPGSVEQLRRAIAAVVRDVYVRYASPTPLIKRLPIPANRRCEAAMAVLTAAIDQLLAQHRASRPGHENVVSALMASGMSEKELRDECIALLVAGAEATPAALAWAVTLLALHPDAERRLHAEARAVLGDRIAGGDDLPRLTFTRQVVKETLRLYPPAWFSTRTTTTDATLAGTAIPRGSTVVFSPYVVQHHPGVYEHPDVFDPDRWNPENERSLPRGAFAPFGAGPNKCIGYEFAAMLIELTLASIIARWRLRPEPEADLRPSRSAILHPRNLLVRLQAQSNTDGPAR